MQRCYQLLFTISVVALSWFAMMAVHELGPVIGAFATGGSVTRLVLHPLTISRTDVSPNPNPGTVVWLGPMLGCALPLIFLGLVLRRSGTLQNIAQFFAGFCLIANGGYIAFGSFFQVGDCGDMLRTGTPIWLMLLFGAVTIPFGLYLWHRLGSPLNYVNNPSMVSKTLALSAFAAFVVIVIGGITLSPR